MAGVRTVEEMLDRGGGDLFEITVFGEEPYGNYNRILLSNVLSGAEDESGIFLNSLPWYEENGIRLHAGTRVTRVDRLGRLVHADDGTATPYDKLVIATGSSPFVPDIRGAREPRRGFHQGVFLFRTIDDTRRMIRYARDHEHVTVIGGGLLGLEAARGLQSHGMRVTLVHSAPHLMNQQLDPEAGGILERSVRKLGIDVHVGARTTEILGRQAVTGVRLDDGRTLDCDMVVIAAGIQPNVDLAAGSGLAVERGTVVDDQMRTDDPNVYAVGECAQHRGEVYGLVAPAWEHAVVLADVLTGTKPDTEYHGSRTATKLKVAGVDVAVMGVNTPERDDDEFLVISEPGRGVHLSVVIRNDKLVGATLLGDTRKVAFLTQAFDRGAPLPEERIRLLVDLSDGAEDVGVAEMPADSQVCNCNGVTKGAICGAVADGCGSVGAVMDR